MQDLQVVMSPVIFHNSKVMVCPSGLVGVEPFGDFVQLVGDLLLFLLNRVHDDGIVVERSDELGFGVL